MAGSDTGGGSSAAGGTTAGGTGAIGGSISGGGGATGGSISGNGGATGGSISGNGGATGGSTSGDGGAAGDSTSGDGGAADSSCAPNPCLNGGTCTDEVGDFSCVCAAGYDGKTCSNNIDDCAVAPCLNGGTCVDGVDSFSCTCAPNYSGQICAIFTTPISCKAIKTSNPAAADGSYTIDPDGAGPLGSLSVWCDMTTDGGGYTSYAIDGGISTTRYDQANSCTALGLNMVIPRTQAHLNALFAKYTIAYFSIVPGVYGLAAGDYTGCAMNSTDATCGANWKALDGGAWFAKKAPYTEPNGDYTPGCWLGLDGTTVDEANGFVRINDAGCGYSSGTSYLCSDNVK